MILTLFRWGREEFTVHHPPSLPPDIVRETLVALLESGTIPPRGHNGELRLDIRCWGALREIGGQSYRVVIVRDEVQITPA